jgi:hypothetical protein
MKQQTDVISTFTLFSEKQASSAKQDLFSQAGPLESSRTSSARRDLLNQAELLESNGHSNTSSF